jgi:hypothetical protein
MTRWGTDAPHSLQGLSFSLALRFLMIVPTKRKKHTPGDGLHLCVAFAPRVSPKLSACTYTGSMDRQSGGPAQVAPPSTPTNSPTIVDPSRSQFPRVPREPPPINVGLPHSAAGLLALLFPQGWAARPPAHAGLPGGPQADSIASASGIHSPRCLCLSSRLPWSVGLLLLSVYGWGSLCLGRPGGGLKSARLTKCAGGIEGGPLVCNSTLGLFTYFFMIASWGVQT